MTLPIEQRREWIRSRREQRKLTRRARLHRQTFRYIVLALLLTLGVTSFYYLPWKLDDINKQIVVHNNKVVSDEQVRSVLKDVVNLPIYELDPTRLESKVAELGMVKQAFVRRYALPQRKLVVEILEEFPWASFGPNPDEPTPWVICESGKVVSVEQFPNVFRPALKIYGPPNLHMQASDINQWATWLNLIVKQTGEPVQYLDLRDRQNITVQAGELLLKLGTPDSTLTRRISRLASLKQAIEPIKERLEYIDLGLDSNIPVKIAKKNDNQKFLREKLSHSQL